jgi:hypothetical protein
MQGIEGNIKKLIIKYTWKTFGINFIIIIKSRKYIAIIKFRIKYKKFIIKRWNFWGRVASNIILLNPFDR